MLRLTLAGEQMLRPLIREANLSSKLSFKQNFVRRLSETIQSNIIDDNVNESTTAQEPHTRKQLMNYVKNVNPDLLTLKTNDCVKLTKTRPRDLWLIDALTAEQFFSFIIDDLLKNRSLVIQQNAGPGILTELLLKAGVKPLYIVDQQTSFHEGLHTLIAKYRDPEKEDIKLCTRFDMYRLLHSLKKGAKKKKWKDKSALQVILHIPQSARLGDIVKNLVNNVGYVGAGRPIFYCAIYPSLWNKYINEEDKSVQWTPIKIFMCNFFNNKILGEVSREAFVPWEYPKSYPPGIKKITENDWKKMYIVKLEAKPDLFDYIDQHMLPVFFKFLRYLTFGKHPTYLIAKIELLFPGLGLKLIEHNYKLYTPIKDLSYKEFLDIFATLKDWPEFEKIIMDFEIKDNLMTFNKE